MDGKQRCLLLGWGTKTSTRVPKVEFLIVLIINDGSALADIGCKFVFGSHRIVKANDQTVVSNEHMETCSKFFSSLITESRKNSTERGGKVLHFNFIGLLYSTV